METRSLYIKVSDSIGNVSAECTMPGQSKCIMTLAHGAGAGIHHAFMATLSDALAESGIATMRFNFPFTENKKRRPDTPAVAHQTIEAALARTKELFPKLPVFASGKSFGGRMTSQYLATHPDPMVKGIIFYGFPLHPQCKPAVERAAHLKDLTIPMLFLQGTRDELATIDLIESVCASLPLADLVKIEGANHAFKAGKQNTMRVLSETTNEWISKILQI